MTEGERDDLKRKLVILKRQKSKLAAAVLRYENIIEELLSQLEKYPEENAITEELEDTRQKYEAKKAEHQNVSNAVSGIEWLLEE